MAERRTKKEAAPKPAAQAEPAESERAESEPAESGAAESEPAPEPAFENRAARRARKKGAQAPKAVGKIDPHGNRGPTQAQRSWANRRSG